MDGRICTLAVACAMALATSSRAAFMVETRAGGKAVANYNGAGTDATAHSNAFGTTPGLGSKFGGPAPQSYVFSYTPGTDVDNTVIPADTDLGNGVLASGLVGGVSGTYNVYATWPSSVNINVAGSTFTATQNGANVVSGPVNQNDPSAGTNKWYLIGTVNLLAGTTYTVTQDAVAPTFVGQRSAGVMWERVIPEPASLSMLGMAVAGLVGRRRPA